MFKPLCLGISLCVFMLLSSGSFAASDPGSGLEFTDLGSTVRIDGCTGSCPANLIIPGNLASAPGKPVAEIANGAFDIAGSSTGVITSVTLPSSLVTIGDDAFRQNSLSSLTLPSGVETIGERAFLDNNITSLILNDGLTDIEFGAFTNNPFTSVNIPGTVTNIGLFVFINSSMLTTVHFEGDRPAITDNGVLQSFGGIPNLMTITYSMGSVGWPGADIVGITPTLAVMAAPTSVKQVPGMSLPGLVVLAFLLLFTVRTRKSRF